MTTLQDSAAVSRIPGEARVIFRSVSDSRSRLLSVVQPATPVGLAEEAPGGDHAGPADQAGAGDLRALRPGAVAADSPPGRPVLRRAWQAGAVHGAAENEHHRQLLRLPGAAVCRRDTPPLRGSRRVAGRRVQPPPPP